MAQRVITTYIDDLDGSEAHTTVPFALDGKDYEIDLSNENANKLREVLATFIEKGRKPSTNTKRGGGRSLNVVRSSTSYVSRDGERQRNQQIREWARTQGMSVSERGRIPGEVIEAFEQAEASGPRPVVQPAIEKDDDKPAAKPASVTKADLLDDPDGTYGKKVEWIDLKALRKRTKEWLTERGVKVAVSPSNAQCAEYKAAHPNVKITD